MAYPRRVVELALIALAAGVLVFHGWSERRHATERARMIDALVARNASEYAGLRMVDDPPKPRAVRALDDSDFQVGS